MKLSSPSKGRRLIILHARTRHGWVTTRGPDGAPLKLSKAESSDLKTVRLTAEMMYEANASLGDYHDNMSNLNLKFPLFSCKMNFLNTYYY
jgi:hypothetical protein